MTISKWPLDPTICEINARVLLHDLSQKYGPIVDLNCAPLVEWGTVANFGFDGLRLSGVWERSPPGITIANQNEILLNDFRRPLPDFRPQDNVESSYCLELSGDGR